MSETEKLIVCGETLLLHPDRAVIWPAQRTLIVADTHFGKSSVFGRHGLAVPAGCEQRDRERLSRLVAESGARRLVILGDFLHEPLAPDSEEAEELARWSVSLAPLTIQVIAGNHDRGVSSGWRGTLHWIAGERLEPPFRFIHDAAKGGVESDASRSAASQSNGWQINGWQSRSSQSDEPFSLSGHIHPVIALRGLRKKAARVPAFWLQERGLVLPAFGTFTGGYLITPACGDRLFAVSPERVVAFPAYATK